MSIVRIVAWWLLAYAPLGRLRPWIFGVAIGRRPHYVGPSK